jgi:hypothetical protein
MARLLRGRARRARRRPAGVGSIRVAPARPPAVAVVGLRRSGRTGKDETPRGRIAPARRGPALDSRPRAGAWLLAQEVPRRQAHGALEDVKKVITGLTTDVVGHAASSVFAAQRPAG